MSKKSYIERKSSRRLLSLTLCLVMLAALLPAVPAAATGLGDLTAIEQPVLVVSGNGLIAGGSYTAGNISNERSYTLDELKAVAAADPNASGDNQYLFSAINSSGAKSFYRGEGVRIDALLAQSGLNTSPDMLSVKAFDNFTISFNPAPLRYFYPDIVSDNEANKVPAPSLIAWAGTGGRNEAPALTSPPPETARDYDGLIGTMVGQLNVADINNNLFSNASPSQTIIAGGAIEVKPVNILGAAYTRAEMLMKPRAERAYTYSSQGGDRTEKVRGVPLAVLLENLSDNAVIEFHAADNYAVGAIGMTKSELTARNAILAYEIWNETDQAWDGIYSTAKSGPELGYFTLYADESSPAKMIDSISEKAAALSPYKHITNGGLGGNAPYNIDALTSATLTVEGPGVVASTPVSVRELEETTDSNIYRGVYSDNRGAFSYEGVKLLAILDGLVNKQVERLGDDVVVVFKNRWRQEVGRLSYTDIKAAATPVIMAYGTSGADGTTMPPAPFVFNLAAGLVPGLGNDDGPLKLVYDSGESFTSVNSSLPSGGKFGSVAYLYIEEGTPPPGFKHTEAAAAAYDNIANTEHLLSLTGDALGREVNFTVAELEAMVGYDGDGKPLAGGKGYRDEYSLSNTTYWYVNEYEGVKLWDLLTGIGVDPAGADNDNILVSFASWDNYQISAQFSFYQLAHPDLFYFYEKSPLDIGTNRPSKAQLATEEYQPDNQVGNWVLDANGYPVKTGYPVMLAYGVNGYPYVRDSSLAGYKSGLGNDGGPMRLIYGKTDGLNRSNPDALENYAYFFNNGSQQLQRVQEIYVGNSTRYSTHLQNPDPAYAAMKDLPALSVDVISAGITTTHYFTLAELENILYGPGVSKRDRDTERRQEKGYYYYKNAGNGDKIEDLFEGVSLEYLLTEYIGLQGTLGSVELYNGGGSDPAAVYDLAAISDKGYNSVRGTDKLGMAIAFAKNGYPLVGGSGSPGYIGDDTQTGKTIKNSGGPLQFVRAQTSAEYASGSVDVSNGTKTSVENLTRIVVNLDPDVYAHTGAEYAAYAGQSVLFSGAVSLTNGVNITVGNLETKQRYMVTDSYTVGGNVYTYRGLDLARLLNDKDIGASALMDGVTVKNSAGGSITLTLAELTGKKAMLAYGIAKDGDPSDGKPLTPNSGSPGYDAAYQNSGGPLRLIFAGGADAECITNVSEIEVSASTLDGWKHTSGNFAQYAAYELAISGQNLAYNKTYTVADLEAMDNIIVFDAYQMGNTTWTQGVDLYKLLQNIGFAEGLDSSTFTANSVDNYPISFNATDLKEGVNGKPILVAFGQGPSQANGLPLVPDITSPGYDPNVGNSSGPLRLVVHDNTGWCVKYLNSIVVGAAGGNPDPNLTKDFSILGLKGGAAGYSVAQLAAMGADTGTYTYTSGGSLTTDTAKGVYLYDLLRALGVGDKATVTINCTDNYENTANGVRDNYNNVPMSEINDQRYLVAYELNGDSIADVYAGPPQVTSAVRIYRDTGVASNSLNRCRNIKGVTVTDYGFTLYPGGTNDMPQASVRAVVTDAAGGVWAGTNGAGAAYISPAGVITKYSTTSAPALKTDFVTGLALAPDGSVWLSQGGSVGSQNAPPSAHYGFASFQDGQFAFYDGNSSNSTLPNDCVYGIDVDKDGIVWVGTHYTLFNGGMEGGLTKFNPSADTWRTWKMEDGLPTVSTWAIKGDNKGGAWVTTYRTSSISLPWPDESYAHISADGTVTSYPIPAGDDFTWSRSIALDPQGGVYITRMSGAHDPANDGGWLDYIAPNGSVKTYKGDDLIPDLKTKAKQGFYPEIRTVFADPAGGLWLSTNGLGVYRCGLSGGNITIEENYSSENGSWPAGAFDDVWSIYVSADGKAIFGSNGGVACSGVDLGPIIIPPNPDWVGDATEDTALLKITGAVEKPGYFSQDGLKAYTDFVQTITYSHLNSAFTPGVATVTGIYLDDLMNGIMTLAPNAESVTLRSSDNMSVTYKLNDGQLGVYSSDIEGHKMMLFFDGANLRLAVGQAYEGHVNYGLWMKFVVSVTVNAAEPALFRTVTFDYNDGLTDDSFVEVEDGMTVSKPADPVREDYDFLGWFLGEDEFDFDSAVTGDITLTAQWTATAVVEPVVVSATPSAYVTKLNGNQNDLTITITELYSDGASETITTTIKINNNAAGTYDVGAYKVYVDTKGNDQIRACELVE